MNEKSRAAVRMVVVGIVLPIAIALAGVIAVVVSLPVLPDPIAVHWGATGAVDGFGSAWLAVVIPLLTVGAYTVLAIVVSRSSDERGRISVNQRMILALAPFLATVVTGTIAGSVLLQRGLTQAADAPSILPVLLGTFGAALALGVAAWFVLPALTPAEPDVPTDLPMLELDDSARASWIQSVGPSRTLSFFVILVMALTVVGGGLVTWAAAPLPAFLVYVVVLVAISVLVVGTLYWRVTIDARGVRVISAVGLPRFVIPLGEVASADVVNVKPTGDFGGWGVRWGDHRRLGVILRSGEALEVRRANGSSLVVTVPRARTAAALLNSLAKRVQ